MAATDKVVEQELYDIVVHDCFSGGAVPKHIFTLEFWKDLKMIMNPEGVLAVVSVLRKANAY
jgi:spermidine synthase